MISPYVIAAKAGTPGVATRVLLGFPPARELQRAR